MAERKSRIEYQILELDLHYARDLNKVNLINKMDVYAVVSISGGDRYQKQKMQTPPDRNGNTNPTWNFPMMFNVDEAALRLNLLTLDFKLVSARAMGDKVVGEVHVQVAELLYSPTKPGDDGKRFRSFQVSKPSGQPKGELSFSYKFSEKAPIATAAAAPAYGPVIPSAPQMGKLSTQPVAAYQAGPSLGYPPPGGCTPPPTYGYSGPPPVGGYGYPPPPSEYPRPPPVGGYGYPQPPYGYPGPPPVGGYGYPPPLYGYPRPPPPGYGYPPPPPPKKNNWGLGLVAGLLGGLAVGDMMDLIGGF